VCAECVINATALTIRAELYRSGLTGCTARALRQGMEYLHSKQIVHFDLKTANLLVGMRDKVRRAVVVGSVFNTTPCGVRLAVTARRLDSSGTRCVCRACHAHTSDCSACHVHTRHWLPALRLARPCVPDNPWSSGAHLQGG
jgi:serine/threonine protein kinase